MSKSKPRAEHQKLAAGAVCLLIALLPINYINTIVRYDGPQAWYPPAMVLALLLLMLYWLKMLLPFGSHQRWLKILLIGQFFPIIIGEAATISSGVLDVDGVSIFFMIPMLLTVTALVVLVLPQFHLLRGLIRKKSTENTAGVLTLLSSLLLLVSWSTSTWLQRSVSALVLLCQAVAYFSWPVLSKAILTKQLPPEEVQEDFSEPQADPEEEVSS